MNRNRFLLFSTLASGGLAALVFFLNVFLIAPKFMLLYQETNSAIPAFTRLTLMLCNFAKSSFFLFMPLVCFLGALFVFASIQMYKKENPMLMGSFLMGSLCVGAFINLVLFFSLYLPIFSIYT